MVDFPRLKSAYLPKKKKLKTNNTRDSPAPAQRVQMPLPAVPPAVPAATTRWTLTIHPPTRCSSMQSMKCFRKINWGGLDSAQPCASVFDLSLHWATDQYNASYRRLYAMQGDQGTSASFSRLSSRTSLKYIHSSPASGHQTTTPSLSSSTSHVVWESSSPRSRK